MTEKEQIKKEWIDKYIVHSYEVDMKGQAAIPALCRYMQESAWHHAENLRVGYYKLNKKNMMWVLAQQFLRIVRLPQWQETLEIHTWPSGRGRLSYYRDFRIIDEKERIIAAATTSWYALDIASRRPQNIDDFFDYDFDSIDQAVSHQLKKIEQTEDTEKCQEFQVFYSNLDVNGHVNNTSYIQWILDCFSLDFRKSHILKEIEINYLAEAGYNERILALKEEKENGNYIQTLSRNSDGKQICRSRTKWNSIY